MESEVPSSGAWQSLTSSAVYSSCSAQARLTAPPLPPEDKPEDVPPQYSVVQTPGMLFIQFPGITQMEAERISPVLLKVLLPGQSGPLWVGTLKQAAKGSCHKGGPIFGNVRVTSLGLEVIKEKPGQWDTLWVGRSKRLKKVPIPHSPTRQQEVTSPPPLESPEAPSTPESAEEEPKPIPLPQSEGEGKKESSSVPRRRRLSENSAACGPPPAKPRGILKTRRCLSESHIGSLEEFLDETLLQKYGSAERVITEEYGCLEALWEKEGLEEQDEEEEDELSASDSSLKRVTFNQQEKTTHLFFSGISIVKQQASDDRKEHRKEMKELRRQSRVARRHQQLGLTPPSQSRESSEGGGQRPSSSGAETTDTECSRQSQEEGSSSCQGRQTRRGKGKKKRKGKKTTELSNQMIFQLDVDS